MFEALAEFLHFPRWPSNAACPQRSGGTTNPARLSLLTFFGEAKKVSALSGASPDTKPAAGTSPGLPRKPSRNEE